MFALDLVRVIFYGLKKKNHNPSKGKQKEKNQNRTKDYYNNKKQQLQQKSLLQLEGTLHWTKTPSCYSHKLS